MLEKAKKEKQQQDVIAEEKLRKDDEEEEEEETMKKDEIVTKSDLSIVIKDEKDSIASSSSSKTAQNTPRGGTQDAVASGFKSTTTTTPSSEYFTCVRAMCEHDEGWHLAESFVPLTQSSSCDPYAAYLARVMNIIKTGSVASETRIFFNDAGRKLIAEIENKAVAVGSNDGGGERKDMGESYVALRSFFASEADIERAYSLVSARKGSSQLELELCELKNGKRLWLCPAHVQKTNATVIRGGDSSGGAHGGASSQNSSIYAKMLEFIQQDLVATAASQDHNNSRHFP